MKKFLSDVGLETFLTKLKTLFVSITDFNSHQNNSTVHITSTERTNWNSAKTHADSTHAPVDAEANQNAFSNIAIGNTNIAADSKTDTLTLVGNNITLTPDSTNDKVTFSVKDGSTSTKGIVQLTNSTSSTSTTTAATPNSVKSAYDRASTAITNAANAQSTADSKIGSVSLASGTNNGTIKLTVDGTTTDNIAVQGLGSAAYTASSTYATSTQGTKADNAMPKSGGTFTGAVTLKADPTTNLGAATKQYVDSSLSTAKSYADTKVANLVGTAPETLDTLEEVAAAIEAHQDVTDALNSAIGNKVDKVSGKGLSTNDYTTSEKNKLSGIASGAEVNQNAFSNITVGSTTVAADSKTDTLTLVPGSNVTITPDATNDKITIASKDTIYTHPTYTSKTSGLYKITVDGTGHVSAATAVAKSDITALGIPGSDTDTWRPLGTTADTACAGNDSRLSDSRPASDVYAWAKASSKPSYSWSEITSKPSSFTPASHTHTKSQITDFPTSLPASDVYSWAKASSKPSYTASEVGAISTSENTTLNATIVLGKNDEYGMYPNTNNYCQLGRANLKFYKIFATNGYYDKINDGTPITSANIGSQSVNYATSAESATSSTKATQDSAGQQINTTYIKALSASGKTITYTKGDGTTGTITTQDTNTDTKVTNTLGTTTKAYVTGTTSSSTNTGTQIFDTGVYLDTTAGRLTVSSLKIGSGILSWDSTNRAIVISV